MLFWSLGAPAGVSDGQILQACVLPEPPTGTSGVQQPGISGNTFEWFQPLLTLTQSRGCLGIPYQSTPRRLGSADQPARKKITPDRGMSGPQGAKVGISAGSSLGSPTELSFVTKHRAEGAAS